MRVVIVEDNPLIAMDLAEEVRAAGAEVIASASTGEEGATLLRTLRPDLALLDVELADDIPGHEVAAAARKGETLCVFITGRPEAIPDAVSEQWPVLSKPVTPAEVAEVIAYVRRLKRAKRMVRPAPTKPS